jgi:hypothetical protein
MTLGPQSGEEAGNRMIQIQQEVTGIVIARERPKVYVIAFAIADAQEGHRGGVREQGSSPLSHAGIRLARAAVNQAYLVKRAGHGGELAA